MIPDIEDEHLALARLRHTHIVPLFSEHTFPDRGLRGLCMPFLGSASLARILEDLNFVPLEDRSGELLIKVIDRYTRETPAKPRADGPFRRSLAQASYVDAMTWIASCLADALQYSHARARAHGHQAVERLDHDGRPADAPGLPPCDGPILAGEQDSALGGTPGWMSPEQERAMTAIGEGHPVPVAVDERSDIFALGILLGHALGIVTPARAGNEYPREVGPGRRRKRRSDRHRQEMRGRAGRRSLPGRRDPGR